MFMMQIPPDKMLDPRFNMLDVWFTMFMFGRLPAWMYEDEKRKKKVKRIAEEVDEERILCEPIEDIPVATFAPPIAKVAK